MVLGGLLALLVVAVAALGVWKLQSRDHRPSVDVTLGAALSAQRQGDVPTARALYAQVLARDPDNKYAHFNLGVIAQSENDLRKAASEYAKAEKADPGFAEAFFNHATVVSGTAPGQAIELYRRVIALKPLMASAHLNLGLLLVKSGESDEGLIELRTAVHQDASLLSRIPAEYRPVLGATPGPTPTP